MPGGAKERKKKTVILRIERLRKLIEEDAPSVIVHAALNQVGRALDDLIGSDDVHVDPAREATAG